ncbi:hypothetical protein DFJ58DRAFT_819426, partial [Suillus subalutaceus]|uniref:uncharacterized protein n=1 Tax=Suillus subalutaceus TaxID=48586 RepID=UPI001B86F797
SSFPFTSLARSRTFCHDYITVSIQHSPQCPIASFSLSLDDTSPANPIMKLEDKCTSSTNSLSKAMAESLDARRHSETAHI